jgi:hypothetical protein
MLFYEEVFNIQKRLDLKVTDVVYVPEIFKKCITSLDHFISR